MVRALLAGVKTQTRRLLKPDLYNRFLKGDDWRHEGWWADRSDGLHYMERLDRDGNPTDRCESVGRCPYGRIGDRLWVREAWRSTGHGIQYRADARTEDGDIDRWRSPIHMPRAKSRILLEIESVHVERLNDIAEVDARAEGMGVLFRGLTRYQGEARDTFNYLWDTLHPATSSWKKNPWVWVIRFRRIKPA